jgi:glycosyltransferase involved in cell wall biosynthesis
MTRPSVAIVHDYLTQRGGAERVVLAMLKAFPAAPVYTSFYLPEGTFPEFKDIEVRTLPINRVAMLRSNHRLALPFLAESFSRLRVSADVVLCSSSGWAHGVTAAGRKIVYCYTPARWLYQSERQIVDRAWASWIIKGSRPYLERWDRRAAASASAYLTTSRIVKERIRNVYGIDATVLPAPYAVDPGGHQVRPGNLASGYLLCVSRLLPYKNLDAIVSAFQLMRDLRLVLVGAGPEERRLRAMAPPNVQMIKSVTDDELRWLYANCIGLVAAGYEDYGLTPVEAAAFGKPAATLRWGGFIDTVQEDRTGVFFDEPTPQAISAAVGRLVKQDFDSGVITTHSEKYSVEAFVDTLSTSF